MRLSRRVYFGVDPVVLVEVLLFFFFAFFLLFLPVPDIPASAPPLALAFGPVPASVLPPVLVPALLPVPEVLPLPVVPPVVLVPAWANAPAVASAALARTARLVFHILICVPPQWRGEMAARPR
jgi:hypothetical protein